VNAGIDVESFAATAARMYDLPADGPNQRDRKLERAKKCHTEIHLCPIKHLQTSAR
jgi:hypothetical protein